MVTTDAPELEKVGLSFDVVDTKSEPAMPAAASMPNLSPEKLEAMKKEVDVDFRLGIPAGGEG